MSNNNQLNDLWLTESIRLTEQQSGPLADADANRKARAFSAILNQQIIDRAKLLAQRDGLVDAQLRWLQGAKLAGLLLLLFALITGGGLAITALGDGTRPTNIFWAGACLLGLNLITLSIWCLTVLFPHREAISILGRLWLWLTGIFSRQVRAAQLVPALIILLNRQQAAKWGVGVIVHGLWALTQLSALTVLFALLTTRYYSFIWQTTLLSSSTFINITQCLGSLPALFGFPVPDVEIILASGHHVASIETARYAWAGWLIGITTIYGLVPRVLLMLFCMIRWRVARSKLSIDLTLAENIILAERLQPNSEPLAVLDNSSKLPSSAFKHQITHLQANGRVLVAIELDQRQTWPPVLSKKVHNAGIINDRYQRQQLLANLQRAPAERLLITCDTARSPDRGSINFMAELAENTNQTRVWLLTEPASTIARLIHWRNALKTISLLEADLNWLESDND